VVAEGWAAMASRGARAYNGDLGADRPAGGQGGGVRGASPPEADDILVQEHIFFAMP